MESSLDSNDVILLEVWWWTAISFSNASLWSRFWVLMWEKSRIERAMKKFLMYSNIQLTCSAFSKESRIPTIQSHENNLREKFVSVNQSNVDLFLTWEIRWLCVYIYKANMFIKEHQRWRSEHVEHCLRDRNSGRAKRKKANSFKNLIEDDFEKKYSWNYLSVCHLGRNWIISLIILFCWVLPEDVSCSCFILFLLLIFVLVLLSLSA